MNQYLPSYCRNSAEKSSLSGANYVSVYGGGMNNQNNAQLKNFSRNIVVKAAFIIGLSLLFLIPLTMIRFIVTDRQNRSYEAEQEIFSLWGGRQTIAGPCIAVPFTKLITRETEKGEKTEKILSCFFITPEKLDIRGEMVTEIRSRGIYEVPVYQSNVILTGNFRKPDISELRINDEDVFWDDAGLVVDLPDMRSVKPGTGLLWNDAEREFTSDVSITGFYANTLRSRLPENWHLKDSNTFSIDLKQRGAGSISFIPFGKETEVRLQSDWPSPSFDGAFLPAGRELSKGAGFTADWSVHALARSFPGTWKQGDFDSRHVLESAFGVNLFTPVGLYSKTERAVKYGMLFILLPFVALFLFEVFSENRIHILQYLMVGAGNTVFYLLLLSVSEHTGFNIAYLIGSAATSALIVFYSRAVLSRPGQGYFLAPVMIGLYIFLFTVLQSEDYALLIGSVGLFGFVAVIMILTRKVDWYALNRKTWTRDDLHERQGLS